MHCTVYDQVDYESVSKESMFFERIIELGRLRRISNISRFFQLLQYKGGNLQLSSTDSSRLPTLLDESRETPMKIPAESALRYCQIISDELRGEESYLA